MPQQTHWKQLKIAHTLPHVQQVGFKESVLVFQLDAAQALQLQVYVLALQIYSAVQVINVQHLKGMEHVNKQVHVQERKFSTLVIVPALLRYNAASMALFLVTPSVVRHLHQEHQ